MTSAISENQDVIVQNDLGRKKATIKVGNGKATMVELETGVWSYKDILAALIRAKYSENDMEAIINNSLALIASLSIVSEEKAEQRQIELQEMQEWREKCKVRAKELLAIGEEMGLVDTDSMFSSGE